MGGSIGFIHLVEIMIFYLALVLNLRWSSGTVASSQTTSCSGNYGSFSSSDVS